MSLIVFEHVSSKHDKHGNISHVFIQKSWYKNDERYDNLWYVDNGRVMQVCVFDNEMNEVIGDRKPPSNQEIELLQPLIEKYDMEMVDEKSKL